MKKFLILSLTSLSLLYFVSCNDGSTVSGTAEGVASEISATPAVTVKGTLDKTTPTVKPGTVTPPQDADKVQYVKNPPKANCLDSDDNKGIEQSATDKYNLVFVERKYIGVYNSKEQKVIEDKNKEMNQPFDKLGYYVGTINKGAIAVKSSDNLKTLKNGVILFNRAGDFSIDTCGFNYASKVVH